MAVWDRVLQQLSHDRHLETVAALTACRLVDGKGDQGQQLVIEVPDHRDCECLFRDRPQREAIIARALAAILGEAVSVQLTGAPGSSARGRYRQAEDHPLVQHIRKLFDAEILAFEPMTEAEWDRHLARLSGEGELPSPTDPTAPPAS